MNHDIENIKEWYKQKCIRNNMGENDIYYVGSALLAVIIVIVSVSIVAFS